MIIIIAFLMNTEQVNNFIDACKAQGLNVTYQRIAIYKILMNRTDHPTAEDIYKSLRAEHPTISLATVYKTLETLVEKKLIGKVTHLHEFARYDGDTSRHHHLVCEECKKIVDIHSSGLDGLQLPDNFESEFRVNNYRVQFNGVCRDCQQNNNN